MIFRSKLPFLPILVLTLLGVALLEQGITLAFGDLTLAPLLSIISLWILASFFSWRKVALATPVFALLSYFLILGTAYFPSVRAASVVIAGGLAAWTARQRERIHAHAHEVELILQALPTPWILSDDNGNITRLSPSAVSLFSIKSGDALETSYFAFFHPAEGKGQFIRKYLEAFESAAPGRLVLSLAKDPLQKVSAQFFRLDCEEGRRLLTVFGASDPEKTS